MKQQLLFKRETTEFGGTLLEKKRKSTRPLTTNIPIFITINADITQSGSLLNHYNFIVDELLKWAHQFKITIYSYSINSNHIHICIEIMTLDGYKNFVRTFNGRTAKIIKVKWLYRPHSELVSKGRHLQNVLNYINQNRNETLGLKAYKPRN